MGIMPKVTIKKTSKLTVNDTFNKVKTFLSADKDLKKLDANYQCTFDEKALTGQAKGKMFQANMKVSAAGEGSVVEIVVDLPLALTLAKGMVERTLQKKLDETLT